MKRPQIKGPDLSGLRGKLSKLKDTEVKVPKLKAPKLKRPGGKAGSGLKLPSVKGLKGPSVKRPQLKGPNVNVPEPVRGLYDDLRERHLLVVVAALLVAIVAVPLLVRSDAEQAPPPAPIVDVEEGLPLDPAVAASNPGLRDFHERLDSLRARNPFKQQLVPPDPEASASGSTGSSSDSSTGLEIGPGAGTGSDDGSSAGSTPSGSSGSGSSGSGSSGSGSADDGSQGDGTDKGPRTVLLEPRIDVKVGKAGSETVKKGVKLLTLLPTDKNPILQYAGSDRDAKGASFVVSSDVVSTSGKGVCKPKPSDCRFLHLKVGQRKVLERSNGTKFTIELLGVSIERVPAGKSAATAGEGSGEERTSAAVAEPAGEPAEATRRAPSRGLVAELAG